jgi:hypothetical protein
MLCLTLSAVHHCCCCRALGPVEAEAIPGLKDIHKFVDPYEVEIIARCCR